MVSETETEIPFPTQKRVNRKTCGDCKFYRGEPTNFKHGTCYGNSPTLMFLPKGPIAVRPAVSMDDPACRHLAS